MKDYVFTSGRVRPAIIRHERVENSRNTNVSFECLFRIGNASAQRKMATDYQSNSMENPTHHSHIEGRPEHISVAIAL